MRTTLQAWGNQLAVQIPESFARQLGLRPDSMVEITVVDRQIAITPVGTPTLSALLATITADNRHTEQLRDDAPGIDTQASIP